MLKIAFFSLKDNIGCTSIAVHVANYLAGIKNMSVAFVEPKRKGLNLNGEGESKFAKCNVDYEDDGTFIVNSVRYYPSKRRKAWVYDTFELCDSEVEPTEDIQIYDFGKVGFLHEFGDEFDKIYLCTDGNGLADENSFVKDTKTNPDVILFGASKEVFANYQQMGFRCVLIGDKKEERIPRNFAAQLEILLRLKGITPPTYHSDWIYAKIEFDYKPDPKPEEKQGFLSKFLSKKKNKEQDVTEKNAASEEKEIVTSDIDVVEKKEVRKANEFKINEFVAVPAPEDDEPEDEFQAENAEANSINENTPGDTVPDNKSPDNVTEKAIDLSETEKQKEIEDKAKAKQEETFECNADYYDEMTKLLNKKAFNEAIREFDINKGALIFIDINDLKVINNTLGREKGDKVILAVAKELFAKFKTQAYRIGGDEFICLIKEDDVDKKMKAIVKALNILTKKDKDKIIYSIAYGIAYCDGIKDIFALKAEADSLMYAYKKKNKAAEKPEKSKVALKEKEAKKNVAAGQVKGILGKVIKYVVKNGADTFGIYIVTKDKKLFIFDDVNVFFAKLELLKREIRNLDKVHYVIITHLDNAEPTVISDDKDLDDVFMFLEALDSDLREHHLTDDEIKEHKELVLFEEVLIA